MWAGREAERDSIRAAGIDLAPGELFAAATGAENPGVIAPHAGGQVLFDPDLT